MVKEKTQPKPKRGRRRRPKKTTATASDSSGHASVGSDQDTPSRNDLPEFFKIYLPALCSDRMRIPPEFLEKFGENIPTIVTLIMPSGMSWEVHMLRISEHWFFQKGWPEFVQENSVEEGDFMIFTYAGNAVFSVKVFACDGCRKRIGRIMLDEEPVENTQGEDASEPESDDDRATGRNAPLKCSTTIETGLRNPYFSVTMQQYFIDKCCLYIPAAFWRAHMIINKELTTCTLWIKDKSWAVRLCFASGRLRFSSGFMKFAQDNCIEQGNECTFQLMDSANLSLKVIVSR